MKDFAALLAEELGKSEQHVRNVIELMDAGNTIPFIARYRKEAHGAMDDTSLRALEDRLKYLRSLEERKTEVLRALENQEKLTDELAASVEACTTLAQLEDVYRPYKQKRRTRASMAKEKGLEPLAAKLLMQLAQMPAPEELAAEFISEEKGVSSAEEALAGASDIVAEMVSDSPALRGAVRAYTQKTGRIAVTAAKDEDSVYHQYYEFSQPVAKMQGHQVLAVNRGEKEGFLKVSLEVDSEGAVALLERGLIKGRSPAEAFLKAAAADGYTRLMAPSVENEIRAALTEAAAEGAIHNFALNLKPLLMQPPVNGKVTMGLDPGYRMGCKVAVVDGTGKVLDTTVVYPALGERQKNEAVRALKPMIARHKVVHLAIGNGTASRETEQMAVELLRECPGVSYAIVNEAGASVYSASKLAAEEFPQYDVNLRSAVSIARRLQDPLAELVKIDPKAIGVGQYQHDMPQKRLDETLSAVVEDCVNAVGVDLNTASPSLLAHVSGLTKTTAGNIVKFREENGVFTARRQLLKVPKVGPKAFEQCAGFLRIRDGKDILDNTGVHPESYTAARTLLERFGCSLQDVKEGKLSGLADKVRAAGEESVAEACGIGVPTLRDILQELGKPGRDPREELPPPVFRTDVLSIADLKPGMILTGTVRNVIDFGAFVDIGVHQDGLVHISELADRFVKHPSDVLSVGETVKVLVLGVDEKKKRISLSIKQAAGK